MTVATVAWRQAAARVARQLDVGAEHRWLDLALPGDVPAPEPGQFVQLLLPATAASAFLPRPMSVAAARRTRGTLTLGFLYAPVGTGTRALAALAPGAPVEVLGPLGRGYPLETQGTPLLVAGGRGIAPLLFAADVLGRAGRRAELLFGARDRAHLVGVDEARRRLADLGGKLHLCTDDGSRGMRGNVVDLLERVAGARRDARVVHACGPHGMLAAVAAWGLRRGVKTFLAMESVMACGTGVCRGCPLPRSAAATARYDAHPAPSLYGNREWAMCCTDGPVFEAADLDWSRVE